jgi:hypothetical protein
MDYLATSRRIVFPPGVTEVPITVPIFGNRTPRGDGMFTVTITSETAIGGGTAQVKILDPNEPKTMLTMNSQRYSYVGDGRARLLTTADTNFTISRNGLGGVTVETAYPDSWAVSMTRGDWTALAPGKYENAVSYPVGSPGMPGLIVSGDGAGCDSTGRFTVTQADYAGDGSVEAFAADFEQRCTGFQGKLFGSVRVNAIPLQASVTNAVIAGSTAEFTVTLNPASTRSEMVRFRTFNGTALAGVDYSAMSTDITFAAGETEKTVQVPLLAGAQAGKRFFGALSSNRTPLWIGAGLATIE